MKRPGKGLDQKIVAAVDRALSVLAAFQPGDTTLSLVDLSQRTGLYKSTILRLATTLEQRGYLVRTRDGSYQIGPTPLYLSAIYQATIAPNDIIMPLLNDLRDATGESAVFMVRHDNVCLQLLRAESKQIIRDHFLPGTVSPIDRGAGGLAIVAFTKPYSRKYDGMRRRLVVITKGELTPDVCGIAVPVFGPAAVVGSVMVIGPAYRFRPSAVTRYKTIAVQTARKISVGLGGDTAVYDQFMRRNR